MLNLLAVWLIDSALVLFAIFKGNQGMNQKPVDGIPLTSYQFSLYHSKKSLLMQVVFWVVFFGIFLWINLYDLNGFLLLSLPLVLWHLILTLRRMFWKLEVDGQDGWIRTGLLKRRFSFTDITKVTAINGTFISVDSGFVSHLIFYKGERKFAKIPVSMMNYPLLLNALVSRDVSGAESLIDEFGFPIVEKETEKPGFLERRLKAELDPELSDYRLYWIFTNNPEWRKPAVTMSLSILISLTLLVAPAFFDGIISGNAYSAREILIGFIVWLSTWVVFIYISRTVFLVGAIFLLFIARQKGKYILPQVLILLFFVIGTRVGLDFVLIHGENARFTHLEGAILDLQAIDSGELEEQLFNLPLENRMYARRVLFPDGTPVVYRLQFPARGTYFNFTREYDPVSLRVSLLEREVEAGFSAMNAGEILLRFTPNMRLVVEVEFVELRAMPEVEHVEVEEDEEIEESEEIVEDMLHVDDVEDNEPETDGSYRIYIDSPLRYPFEAMKEFFRTSPHMDHVIAAHYLDVFTEIVSDSLGVEVKPKNDFSFLSLEGNQTVINFTAEAEEIYEVRAIITFNWDEPAPLDASAVELALNHLVTHFPGREFKVLDDGDLTTVRPIGFYDVANTSEVAWLWLLLGSTGDWRIWGIEWNRE